MIIEGAIDINEAKDYNGLTPEDLEIFLRLPVSNEVRRQLYETLKNAATQDRHPGICGSSDEKTPPGSDVRTEGGG